MSSADSAGTYVDLALVRSVNADGVFRKHHARHCDFRRGEVGDWRSYCPVAASQQCPQSMSAADFAALPASIEVREVHLLSNNQGFVPRKSFWSPP